MMLSPLDDWVLQVIKYRSLIHHMHEMHVQIKPNWCNFISTYFNIIQHD